jgi:O-antigen/teichoic acid export membrane protein
MALQSRLANIHRPHTWPILDRLHRDSLFRNSMALMLTTIVTSLLGYCYWVAAAHLYSPRQIGAASAAIALIGLASNLFGSGLAATLVQRLPRCTDDRSWSSAITAALLLGTVSGILAALLCVLLLDRLPGKHLLFRSGPEAALLLCSVPIWTVAAVVDAIFVAQRRAVGMLARNGACALVKIPLMTLPAMLGAGTAPSLVSSWSIAIGVSALGALLLLFRGVEHTYRPRLDQLGAASLALLRVFGGQQCIGLGGMAWMYLLPYISMHPYVC